MANQATSDANAAAQNADTATGLANEATSRANKAAEDADAATGFANDAAILANATANRVAEQEIWEAYGPLKLYKKGNKVEIEGSSYILDVDTSTGISPLMLLMVGL